MASRPGASTLITSAPRSASIRPQIGPDTICDRSRTRTPCSGARRLVVVGGGTRRGSTAGGSGEGGSVSVGSGVGIAG